ncbi:MAG TPA: type III secretion protein, partial [Desulfobacteraceae bacterium]|nr:type III secretion protein [Desulfobacteraceae bacterium]
ALLLYPILNLEEFPVQLSILPLSLGMISEIMLGVIIGLSVRMIFAGVQLAGQLVGFQMGLAMANVMDPSTSEQLPLLGELNNIFAILIFLTINAHHWFLHAVADSFRLVPPFAFHFSNSLMEQLVSLGGRYVYHRHQSGGPRDSGPVSHERGLWGSGPNRPSDEYLFCGNACTDPRGAVVHRLFASLSVILPEDGFHGAGNDYFVSPQGHVRAYAFPGILLG